jgi:hypothetical protein
VNKLFTFVLIAAFAAIAAAGAAIWYVQPVRPLDFAYTKISIPDKIVEMVQRRSPEVRLTESDINSLVKAALAERAELPHGLKLTGAEAKQQGDLLTVDTNAVWHGWIAIGATLTYRMSYREPELILTRESVRIKDFAVPPGWLQTPASLRFNLYDKLPKLIGIQSIAFDPEGLRIALKLR